MAGIHLDRPFPLYPHGFPREVMDEFERRIGRRALGNKAASGTEIIEELGAEHMRTGSPIVYTSADSVFQVAAHEEVIPLWELYKICETAREILRGPYEVGRVIARPFLGAPGRLHAHPQPPRLRRSAAPRHAARPAGGARRAGPQRGQDLRRLPRPRHWRLREDQEQRRGNGARRSKRCGAVDAGLIFVNLVDFDQLYGHRNDVEGYGAALERVRRLAAGFWNARCRPDDLAIFTADHGCDPTVPGTDHTREYVPAVGLRAESTPRRRPGAARFAFRYRPDRGGEF